MAAKGKADNRSFDEIYLETDEEVTSAIEKIKKSTHQNVALCLPRNSVLGQSIVNLKLIYKQAAADGKEIALVSADKITRDLADRIGFGTASAIASVAFKDAEAAPAPKKSEPKEVEAEAEAAPVEEAATEELAQAGFTSQAVASPDAEPNSDEPADTEALDDTADESATEEEPSLDAAPIAVASSAGPRSAPMVPSRGNLRFYRQKKRNWLVPAGIALGILLMIGGGVVLAMPKGSVVVAVQAQPLTEVISTSADTTATAIDTDKKVLPGKVITHEQVSKVSAKATGKKDMGTKSTGTITIFNEWDSNPHTFAEGTIVKAKNGNQYVLDAAVTVPGATLSLVGGKTVITPGQKSGPVEAAAAGDGYNIGATSFTIPSLPSAQQEKIYATSSATFTGGTTKLVTVVTQADADKLITNAKTLNTDESIAGLKTAAGTSVAVDKAIKAVKQDVVLSAAVDSQAETVEATVTSTFTAITFTQADLQSLLGTALASKIPEGQKLVTSGDGVSLDTSQFELVSATETRLELTSTIKAFTVKQFEESVVRRALIGVKPAEAKDIVTKYVPVNDVTATVTPNGWPFLPFLSSRLTVTYQYAAQK